MPGMDLQRFPVNRPVRGGIRRRGRVRKELATLKIGLVLEGGGMRGLYTVGVLDWLMEKQFMADYVIGVSAGAGNGSSYVSGQRGRNRRYYTDYANRPEYMSLGNFLKKGSYFDVPLEAHSFDAAVSVESLHHFTLEEKIPLYRNVCQGLVPGGFLIFKWNETDIKVSEVLKLTTEKPVFGHISGKRSNTHWICFMK